MIIHDIYFYEKKCALLRTQILNYIINDLNITKEDYHNFNGKFYITSSINILIDYKKCFDKTKKYLDNFILNYDIIIKLNIFTKNLIEIYTSDSNVFDKDGKIDSLFLFSDSLKYYNCLNNITSNNIYSIIIDPNNMEHDLFTKSNIIKPNKKVNLIRCVISLNNNINIVKPEAENNCINQFNMFLKYFNKYLKTNGGVILSISKFYFSLFKIIKYIELNKYFDEIIYLSHDTRTLQMVEFRTNVIIYLKGYTGKPFPIIEDILQITNKYDFDFITPIIKIFINSYKNEYKYLNEYKTEIFNIKQKNDLIDFYIKEKIIQIKNIKLKINPEYLIKYQFKTWKRILNKYFDDTIKINVLELGCYEGIGSIWFLNNVVLHKNSRLYCVDPFLGSAEYSNIDFNNVYNKFLTNIEHNKNKDKLLFFKMKSDEFLLNIVNKNIQDTKLNKKKILFDIIFIDASHDSRDVIMDSILSWRLLKVGGILIWDDYIWTKMPNLNERPKMAIDSFLEMFDKNYEILSKTTQLIIKKTIDYFNDI